MTGDDWVTDVARRKAQANRDAIEAMVERSLAVPGNYGVLVTNLPGGAVRAELSPDVPFQEVHYRHGTDEVAADVEDADEAVAEWYDGHDAITGEPIPPPDGRATDV